MTKKQQIQMFEEKKVRTAWDDQEETVVCLRGRLVEEFYQEFKGSKVQKVQEIELCPNGPVVAINIPAGQWHTVEVLESGTVIMEVKDGAYAPLEPDDIMEV